MVVLRIHPSITSIATQSQAQSDGPKPTLPHTTDLHLLKGQSENSRCTSDPSLYGTGLQTIYSFEG